MAGQVTCQAPTPSGSLLLPQGLNLLQSLPLGLRHDGVNGDHRSHADGGKREVGGCSGGPRDPRVQRGGRRACEKRECQRRAERTGRGKHSTATLCRSQSDGPSSPTDARHTHPQPHPNPRTLHPCQHARDPAHPWTHTPPTCRPKRFCDGGQCQRHKEVGAKVGEGGQRYGLPPAQSWPDVREG